MPARINQADVTFEIVPEGGPLAERDRIVFEALDATLRDDARFQVFFPAATLVYVEVMTSIPEDEEGRYYLRYSSAKGVTEFWGRVSNRLHIDFREGLVSTPVKAGAPSPTMEAVRS